MPHLILLGDSIFDNGRYTRGGPDVISQVRVLLLAEWQATLLAVDGSTTQDVAGQVARLPAAATHLVLSVGGNDALMHLGVLDEPTATVRASLETLAEVVGTFVTHYRAAVAACLETRLPLTVCTIYDGCFEDAAFQRIASTTVALFNDAIIRVALEHAVPIIDLRFICAHPEDYANAIEPSSIGGEKIARAIAGVVTGVTLAESSTRIVSA
jgi:hypothetical protein